MAADCAGPGVGVEALQPEVLQPASRSAKAEMAKEVRRVIGVDTPREAVAVTRLAPFAITAPAAARPVA